MSARARRETESALEHLAEREGEHPVILKAPATGIDVPLVYDSPHSGRFYPPDFRFVIGHDLLREYEDRFVDLLLGDAPDAGVVVVAANFPRAYIDPNRAADDLDEEMFETVWPHPLQPTRHSRSGTGLIFRRMQDETPIYDRRLSIEEAKRRIEECWRPYHAALEEEIAARLERHGHVFHVNWHSMRPVGGALTPDPGRSRADFVIGDLDGTSCDKAFTEAIAETLVSFGYSVAINDPYRGAYVVERHGQPRDGRHSLQVEINRGLYMDLGTLEKIDRFAEIRRDVRRLTEVLAEWARSRRD